MAGAVFHRDRTFGAAEKAAGAASRPLPRGYGLLIAAGVSLGLWTTIALGVAKLLT